MGWLVFVAHGKFSSFTSSFLALSHYPKTLCKALFTPSLTDSHTSCLLLPLQGSTRSTGFSVLPKVTLTRGQLKPGLELPTYWSLDEPHTSITYCEIRWEPSGQHGPLRAHPSRVSPLPNSPTHSLTHSLFLSPVYPMGVGVSRLYSSLTQTLSSSSPLPLPLLEPRLPLGTNLDPDFCKVTISTLVYQSNSWTVFLNFLYFVG